MRRVRTKEANRVPQVAGKSRGGGGGFRAAGLRSRGGGLGRNRPASHPARGRAGARAISLHARPLCEVHLGHHHTPYEVAQLPRNARSAAQPPCEGEGAPQDHGSWERWSWGPPVGQAAIFLSVTAPRQSGHRAGEGSGECTASPAAAVLPSTCVGFQRLLTSLLFGPRAPSYQRHSCTQGWFSRSAALTGHVADPPGTVRSFLQPGVIEGKPVCCSGTRTRETALCFPEWSGRHPTPLWLHVGLGRWQVWA